MWPLLVGGAALGAGNYFLNDKPESERARAYSNATTLGSPWTGQRGAYVPKASLFKDVLGGVGTGASLASMNGMLGGGGAAGAIPEGGAESLPAAGSAGSGFTPYEAQTASTLPVAASTPNGWGMQMQSPYSQQPSFDQQLELLRRKDMAEKIASGGGGGE